MTKEVEHREIGDTDTLVGAYLRDIRKVSLLSPEEEVFLGELVAKGDEAARYRMITANLRLVVKIAKAYVNRGVPFMDLIEEGNIGLMKGVEKFDPKMGCRFSTYSSWWIRQAIERAVYKYGRTVRIPVHVMEDVEKLKRAVRNLSLELGRAPSAEEEREATGFSTEYTEMLKEVTQPIAYLESTLDEEGTISLGETLWEEEAPGIEETVLEGECSVLLGNGLESLEERERTVLKLRFGINCDAPQTLKEIGQVLGVTRERVRQIEKEAMARLRVLMGEAVEAA